MNDILDTQESNSDLMLAIFDEKEERLIEVTANDLTLAVPAGKKRIKRFYLIGDMIYNKRVRVSISLYTDEYSVGVLIGKENASFHDFYSTSTSAIFDERDSRYLNALPVDIMIESKAFSYKNVPISITISAEDLFYENS